MIRAPLGERAYWEKWTEFASGHIQKKWSLLGLPSGNPEFDPQFAFQLAKQTSELLVLRYSRGDSIRELVQHFPCLLDAWELSNRLAEGICREHKLKTCRDWTFDLSNLNHYNWCFWLVGLGLCLEIPEDQWQRLLALIGGEGEDELLDRVIASRTPGRCVGTALLHAKPYARLLKAIDTPLDMETAQSLTPVLGIRPYSINFKNGAKKGEQAKALRDFVQHWYPELKRPAPKNRKAPMIEPYWYIYGDPVKHPLEMGSYFGRWCIEAVAAVKAFGLDDSLCLGHEHYPGDLLRPDGQTTHRQREAPATKPGILARLFGRKPG